METVRRSEVAQRTEVIRKRPLQVSIVGVSGPGGVGKSFFIDDALLLALLDQLMPRSLRGARSSATRCCATRACVRRRSTEDLLARAAGD
jgi:hypothetical protein